MTKFFKIALAAFAALTVTANAQEITRIDEGRHFYSTIEVPAGADQLYVSGKGPGAINPDAEGVARYGSTEEQARSTFTKIKEAVEKAGWSMSDLVMVRVYLVADPAMGKMDFAGFNTAYREFFGTEENPNKPVRAVVEISGLAVDGWLVEIDVRGARTK
ncbi:RidA family protein [Pseudemcibacter aquimaris]|uniref:RidA family protein n=1 Tax=Pseudemcibacter aquimaris TaxID=2857064 RepID=UPI00201399B9|nr:RidA family protein [Pseudemcibacter aquimaris]MCC3862054.1 RidA family protein [Pseudemcibacter aquimaris]WDU58806.1 RidA family protein [Pseudemcibacter aquimaris]